MSRRNCTHRGAQGWASPGSAPQRTGLPRVVLGQSARGQRADMQCAITTMGKRPILVDRPRARGGRILLQIAPARRRRRHHPTPTNVESSPATNHAWRKTTRALRSSTRTPAVLARSNLSPHHRWLVHGRHRSRCALMGAPQAAKCGLDLRKARVKWPDRAGRAVAVGTSGNAVKRSRSTGRTLSTVSPTQLKPLMTGSATDPVVKLRNCADTTLDSLKAMFKHGRPQKNKSRHRSHGGEAKAKCGEARRASHPVAAITNDGVAVKSSRPRRDRREGNAGRDAAHPVRRRNTRNARAVRREWFDTRSRRRERGRARASRRLQDAITSLALSDGDIAT